MPQATKQSSIPKYSFRKAVKLSILLQVLKSQKQKMYFTHNVVEKEKREKKKNQ